MPTYYLGFDAGTQSVKVAVHDDQMRCIASSSHPTTLTYPHPGWVDMDVDEYLALTIQGMADCSAQMRAACLDPADVRAIMGDGIICGIAGVDAQGNAITPYVNYLDSRTAEDEALINSWNLDIWGRETGNPAAKCMFPALFARWFLDHVPGFRDRGAKFVHNAPYVLAHLAGLSAADMFVDWGAMSGWGLGYNVQEKRWSPEQLRLLGLPERMMPRIVRPWDIVGSLTPEMAALTGFAAGTPICGGAGDTMQSMIGSGVMQPGSAVDVAGTCSMFCVSTSGIVPELSQPGNGLIFNSGTLPDTYFYWGYIRTGGLALRWFKDNVCDQANDPGYFDELNRRAAAIAPGSNGVLFLPYLTGGTDDIQDATGCFLNLTMDTDQALLWHAVLEAIGYDYMEIAKLYASAGVDMSRLTITEGGSRSAIWNQMKADMLDAHAVTLAEAGSAVRTDCLFAAYATGALADIRGALEDNLHVKQAFEPHESVHRFYESQYALREKLVKHDLAEAFRTLKSLNS